MPVREIKKSILVIEIMLVREIQKSMLAREMMLVREIRPVREIMVNARNRW